MKRKLFTILVLLVGIAIGAGGTIGLQFLKGTAKLPVFAQNAPQQKDGPLVSVGEFTVNLQGDSFLKTDITLEGVDSKSAKILTDKEPILQDRINSVLSNRSLTDVQSDAARDKLRQELLTELNAVSGNQIKNVLFVSFVYQ